MIVVVFMVVASGMDEHHEGLGDNIMNHIAPIDAKTKDQDRAKQMALARRRRKDLEMQQLMQIEAAREQKGDGRRENCRGPSHASMAYATTATITPSSS